MKLKVVACTTNVLVEAETIDTLKTKIMDRFYLTEDEMSEDRLLVRDNRDLILNVHLITGCVDLLKLEDGFSLDGSNLCKDGDTLVLGWKGPYNVRFVTDFVLEKGHNMKFDDSSTLGQLKRKIKRATGKRLTEKNLPEVLFNEGDNEKPLLYFGFYRMFPLHSDSKGFIDFEIHPHKDNRPVSRYPIMSLAKWDENGNKFLTHYGENACSSRNEAVYKEYKEKIKNEKRKIQSKEEIIENPKKKNNNNKNKIIFHCASNCNKLVVIGKRDHQVWPS